MRVPLKRMSSMWIESIVWRFRDISEKRKQEELIRYQAEGVETDDHANFPRTMTAILRKVISMVDRCLRMSLSRSILMTTPVLVLLTSHSW